jgi:steroid 5-alpha reductase family enzyme
MLISLVALASCLFLLWALSVRISDSSIIDLFWAPAFSVIAWPLIIEGGLTPRGMLLGVLLSVWGVRLAAYLAKRNLGHGEDKRYTAMRKKHGEAWWWRSLFIVFGLQGGLAWLVSWPVRVVAVSAASEWQWTDAVATALVVFGIAFEALGDWQLSRFKADPANKGKIMDRGVWRYTRHPNYFGNFVLWWGFGVFGLAAGAWWSLVGPLVMSVLLLKVSGKDLLEQGMRSRPGYDAYIAKTSGFVPLPPRA